MSDLVQERYAILSIFLNADKETRKKLRAKYPWIPKRVNRRKQSEASRAESRKQGYTHKKDYEYTRAKYLNITYYPESQRYYINRGERHVTMPRIQYYLQHIKKPVKVTETKTNRDMTRYVVETLIMREVKKYMPQIPDNFFVDLTIPKQQAFIESLKLFLTQLGVKSSEET